MLNVFLLKRQGRMWARDTPGERGFIPERRRQGATLCLRKTKIESALFAGGRGLGGNHGFLEFVTIDYECQRGGEGGVESPERQFDLFFFPAASWRHPWGGRFSIFQLRSYRFIMPSYRPPNDADFE